MHFKLQNLNRLTCSFLPDECAGCGWWQGHDRAWSPQAAGRWRQAAEERFGRWGKLAFGDGDLLGMVQFAPAQLFARRLGPGPAGDGAVLLTCSFVARDSLAPVRKSLVLAILPELRQEGIATVEAYCRLGPVQQSEGHLFSQDFLRECGFNPVRSFRGMQLMRLELGGVQKVLRPARHSRRRLLGRIRHPAPAPAACAARSIGAPLRATAR